MNSQKTFHEEITELEDRYIVVKKKDVEKFLNPQNRAQFNDLLGLIQIGRQLEGKPQKRFICFNLENEIDLGGLIIRLQSVYKAGERGSSKKYARYKIFRVQDIAVEIVNAILRFNLK